MICGSNPLATLWAEALEDEEGAVRWLHRNACVRARVQGVRRERRWRRAVAAAEKRLARDDARYLLKLLQ